MVTYCQSQRAQSETAVRDSRAGSKWNYEARVKARCTRHLSVQVCQCAGIPRRLNVEDSPEQSLR